MSDHKSGKNVIKLYSDHAKKSLPECLLHIMASGKRYTKAKSPP
jgi:hypothetical protein